MKTPLLLYSLTVLCALLVSACSNIELVNNRQPGGQFILPVNKAGETADASASLYKFPSGGLGVSLWTGDGAGTVPKLSKSLLP